MNGATTGERSVTPASVISAAGESLHRAQRVGKNDLPAAAGRGSSSSTLQRSKPIGCHLSTQMMARKSGRTRLLWPSRHHPTDAGRCVSTKSSYL